MARSPDADLHYRRVEQQLLAMMDAGELSPGARLPSLRRLSGCMGLSVATVNRAYVELERKGVVEARPRSGFFVRRHVRSVQTPQRKARAAETPRAVTRGGLISTVLEAVGDHELLPLAVVCPAEEVLPGKTLARMARAVLQEQPDAALGYGPVHGLDALRRAVAFRAPDWGTSIKPEELIITGGALEALYISLRCLTRPGDTVIIQSPTYYCFLQLLETLGLRAIELPSCPEDGVDPAHLDEAVRTYPVAACILCPSFNNPDGSLVPEEVKAEIVRILDRAEVPLVEDDVYGDLHFGGPRPRACKGYDRPGEESNVILCSSFSKVLAPGYRVGYMAPGRFMDKALEVKATTNVCCPSLTQLTVAEYLNRGNFDRHLKQLRTAIQSQMQAMRHAVARHFPAGTRVTDPAGGSALWVELPPNGPGLRDGVELFYRAKQFGVGVAPGNIFSAHDSFRNCIRLSCNGVWNERMDSGIKTLGRLAGE